MLCHRPDLIQTFFSTMKSCFYRDIHILMICSEDNFSRLTIRNIRKTYCTAWTLSSFFVRLPAVIAIYRINCLFPGFATADPYRLISIFKFCLQNRIQLCFKFIESSSVILRYTDWFINLFTVFPDCRILFRSGEIFALACRLWGKTPKIQISLSASVFQNEVDSSLSFNVADTALPQGTEPPEETEVIEDKIRHAAGSV